MLTLLVFSRNDTKNALGLAKSMLNAADQVVIVDSSDKKEHNALVEKAKPYRKIEVYYALQVGYAELLRPYGMGKCNGEWILILDTDERLNGAFAKNIKSIIGSAQCGAFAIRRYEEATASSHTHFFTWQIRLFRKSRVSFKGMIHEQPAVHGRLCALSEDYFIAHRTDLMHHEKNEYGKMMLFEMLSYRDYNNTMLDYIRKFFALDTHSAKSRLLLGFASALLTAYEKLALKKPNEEISRKYYIWFYFMRSIAYAHRRGRAGSLSKIWSGQKRYLGFLESERAGIADQFGITRSDLFEISKKLNRVGVIKYLDLDKPVNIDKLTAKYKGDKQGIMLTISLIMEKYKRECIKEQSL